MNKINVTESPSDYEPGSLWKFATGTTYMLIRINHDCWIAADISNGGHWSNIQKTPQDAACGLTFLCHSATITIEPKD